MEWLLNMNGFVRMIIGILIILGGLFLALVVYFYFKNKESIYYYEKKGKLFRVRVVIYTNKNKEKLFKALDNFVSIYESMPGNNKDCDSLNNKLVDFLSKVEINILDIKVEDTKIINLNQP